MKKIKEEIEVKDIEKFVLNKRREICSNFLSVIETQPSVSFRVTAEVIDQIIIECIRFGMKLTTPPDKIK